MSDSNSNSNPESEPTSPQRKRGTPGLGSPDTISALVIVDADTGQAFEYRGPHTFRREGPDWEADIPIGLHSRGGISNDAAANISERTGDIALAYLDTSVHTSGVIDAANVVEGKVTIRVDDPAHIGSDDLETTIDRSEVHK
ncbi:hypothetical protein [Natronorubrum daqingense]|uniref:Uncharacterized protein n=1 Tax=Natronorubrum daqingense TaxID=588898 RepID=A0A1N7G0K7_9EURY|nr:hypothetical protein [Natronorubrum daqingense]SIS06132.1 hypothetical protein SAMN05421809_3640 [Natronorubrum daqingense]